MIPITSCNEVSRQNFIPIVKTLVHEKTFLQNKQVEISIGTPYE